MTTYFCLALCLSLLQVNTVGAFSLLFLSASPRPIPLPPPSWSELERRFFPSKPPPLCVNWKNRDQHVVEEEEFQSSNSNVPILFRERNGWCVFSTRVWLALEIKGVYYHTYLIESQGDTYDGGDDDAHDDGDDDDDNNNRPDFLEGLSLPQMILPSQLSSSDDEDDAWTTTTLHGAETEEDLLNLLHLIDQTCSTTSSTTGDDGGDDTSANPLHPSLLFPTGRDVWEKARAFQECLSTTTKVQQYRESRRACWIFCKEEGYRLDALSRDIFESILDRVEDLLSQEDSVGPFFCGGDTPTAADIVWMPLLERYAAQLPCFHRGLQPRQHPQQSAPTNNNNDNNNNNNRWPNLQSWYRAMDEFVPAYRCRVKGDAPSWRKVLYSDPWWPRADLWHPRDTVGPKGELQATEKECIDAFEGHHRHHHGDELIERGGTTTTTETDKKDFLVLDDDKSNNEVNDSTMIVWSKYASTRPYVSSKSPAHEAANILIRNRKAILKDAAHWLYEEGYYYYDDRIFPSDEDLDTALRYCIVLLLRRLGNETDLQDFFVGGEEEDHHQLVISLLTYLDARMCVPRDMGNLPATTIRRLLSVVQNEEAVQGA